MACTGVPGTWVGSGRKVRKRNCGTVRAHQQPWPPFLPLGIGRSAAVPAIFVDFCHWLRLGIGARNHQHPVGAGGGRKTERIKVLAHQLGHGRGSSPGPQPRSQAVGPWWTSDGPALRALQNVADLTRISIFISAVNARPVFGASCHTCLPARVAAGHNSPFTCPACRLRSWALTPLHRVPPHQYRTCRWAVDASPVRTESTGPTLITAPTPPKHFNRSVTAASSRSRPRHRQVPGPLAVMSSRWRRRRGEDFAVSSTALSGIEATTESGPRCCTKPWGLHRASGNPTRGCLTMER